MTAPVPDDRLQAMAREVAACRDEVVHCTHDLRTLLLEHDVQTAAYRIVTGERDEMRRFVVAALGDQLTDAHQAWAKRLLARMPVEH